MNEYRLEVRVTPREGLLDPQGNAVEHALHSLEFKEAHDVRVGRLIRLRITADDEQRARTRAEAMCRQLLANPVTENFEVEVRKE